MAHRHGIQDSMAASTLSDSPKYLPSTSPTEPGQTEPSCSDSSGALAKEPSVAVSTGAKPLAVVNSATLLQQGQYTQGQRGLPVSLPLGSSGNTLAATSSEEQFADVQMHASCSDVAADKQHSLLQTANTSPVKAIITQFSAENAQDFHDIGDRSDTKGEYEAAPCVKSVAGSCRQAESLLQAEASRRTGIRHSEPRQPGPGFTGDMVLSEADKDQQTVLNSWPIRVLQPQPSHDGFGEEEAAVLGLLAMRADDSAPAPTQSLSEDARPRSALETVLAKRTAPAQQSSLQPQAKKQHLQAPAPSGVHKPVGILMKTQNRQPAAGMPSASLGQLQHQNLPSKALMPQPQHPLSASGVRHVIHPKFRLAVPRQFMERNYRLSHIKQHGLTIQIHAVDMSQVASQPDGVIADTYHTQIDPYMQTDGKIQYRVLKFAPVYRKYSQWQVAGWSKVDDSTALLTLVKPLPQDDAHQGLHVQVPTRQPPSPLASKRPHSDTQRSSSPQPDQQAHHVRKAPRLAVPTDSTPPAIHADRLQSSPVPDNIVKSKAVLQTKIPVILPRRFVEQILDAEAAIANGLSIQVQAGSEPDPGAPWIPVKLERFKHAQGYSQYKVLGIKEALAKFSNWRVEQWEYVQEGRVRMHIYPPLATPVVGASAEPVTATATPGPAVAVTDATQALTELVTRRSHKTTHAPTLSAPGGLEETVAGEHQPGSSPSASLVAKGQDRSMMRALPPLKVAGHAAIGTTSRILSPGEGGTGSTIHKSRKGIGCLSPAHFLHLPRHYFQNNFDVERVLEKGLRVQLCVDGQPQPVVYTTTVGRYLNNSGCSYYRLLNFKAPCRLYQGYKVEGWDKLSDDTVQLRISAPKKADLIAAEPVPPAEPQQSNQQQAAWSPQTHDAAAPQGHSPRSRPTSTLRPALNIQQTGTHMAGQPWHNLMAVAEAAQVVAGSDDSPRGVAREQTEDSGSPTLKPPGALQLAGAAGVPAVALKPVVLGHLAFVDLETAQQIMAQGLSDVQRLHPDLVDMNCKSVLSQAQTQLKPAKSRVYLQRHFVETGPKSAWVPQDVRLMVVAPGHLNPSIYQTRINVSTSRTTGKTEYLLRLPLAVKQAYLGYFIIGWTRLSYDLLLIHLARPQGALLSPPSRTVQVSPKASLTSSRDLRVQPKSVPEAQLSDLELEFEYVSAGELAVVDPFAPPVRRGARSKRKPNPAAWQKQAASLLAAYGHEEEHGLVAYAEGPWVSRQRLPPRLNIWNAGGGLLSPRQQKPHSMVRTQVRASESAQHSDTAKQRYGDDDQPTCQDALDASDEQQLRFAEAHKPKPRKALDTSMDVYPAAYGTQSQRHAADADNFGRFHRGSADVAACTKDKRSGADGGSQVSAELLHSLVDQLSMAASTPGVDPESLQQLIGAVEKLARQHVASQRQPQHPVPSAVLAQHGKVDGTVPQPPSRDASDYPGDPGLRQLANLARAGVLGPNLLGLGQQVMPSQHISKLALAAGDYGVPAASLGAVLQGYLQPQVAPVVLQLAPPRRLVHAADVPVRVTHDPAAVLRASLDPRASLRVESSDALPRPVHNLGKQMRQSEYVAPPLDLRSSSTNPAVLKDEPGPSQNSEGLTRRVSILDTLKARVRDSSEQGSSLTLPQQATMLARGNSEGSSLVGLLLQANGSKIARDLVDMRLSSEGLHMDEEPVSTEGLPSSFRGKLPTTATRRSLPSETHDARLLQDDLQHQQAGAHVQMAPPQSQHNLRTTLAEMQRDQPRLKQPPKHHSMSTHTQEAASAQQHSTRCTHTAVNLRSSQDGSFSNIRSQYDVQQQQSPRLSNLPTATAMDRCGSSPSNTNRQQSGVTINLTRGQLQELMSRMPADTGSFHTEYPPQAHTRYARLSASRNEEALEGRMHNPTLTGNTGLVNMAESSRPMSAQAADAAAGVNLVHGHQHRPQHQLVRSNLAAAPGGLVVLNLQPQNRVTATRDQLQPTAGAVMASLGQVSPHATAASLTHLPPTSAPTLHHVSLSTPGAGKATSTAARTAVGSLAPGAPGATATIATSRAVTTGDRPQLQPNTHALVLKPGRMATQPALVLTPNQAGQPLYHASQSALAVGEGELLASRHYAGQASNPLAAALRTSEVEQGSRHMLSSDELAHVHSRDAGEQVASSWQRAKFPAMYDPHLLVPGDPTAGPSRISHTGKRTSISSAASDGTELAPAPGLDLTAVRAQRQRIAELQHVMGMQADRVAASQSGSGVHLVPPITNTSAGLASLPAVLSQLPAHAVQSGGRQTQTRIVDQLAQHPQDGMQQDGDNS